MNKWKKWFARPAAAVLCTGVLALALSAVPALTLWLGDAGLLAQPHARTQKAGAQAFLKQRGDPCGDVRGQCLDAFCKFEQSLGV